MGETFEFVSIMGTQIMGTLQPFMAFAEEKGQVLATLLYTTGKFSTEDKALAAQKFIEDNDLGLCAVKPVTFAVAGPNSAPEVIREIATQAKKKGERICFNVDGGLNYLIAACAIALEPYHPIYIVATEERAIMYDTLGNSFQVWGLPKMLPIRQILEMQGVEYSQVAPISSLLNSLAQKGKLSFPENSLQNVEIAGMRFECVWNLPNNRICAIRDMTGYSNEIERVAAERQYAQWSTDRALCGQLFDKNIFALTRDPKSEERLKSGSHDAMEVFDCARLYAFHNHPSKLTPLEIKEIDDDLKRLNKFLNFKIGKVTPKIMEAPESNALPTIKDNSLVVCIGTNIHPTLIAIATHKPEHLVLCYTKGKQPVDGYATRIQDNAASLGLKSVTLVPVSLEGDFLDKRLPALEKPDAKVSVNVTPGTKGQGLMLALWAYRHGHAIYSINRRVESLSLLSGSGEEPELKTCSPLALFTILGERLGNNIKRFDEKDASMAWAAPLREFMASLDEEKSELLFDRSIPVLESGGYKLKPAGDKKWRLSKNGEIWEFSTHNGAWFEILCACALKHEGGEDVILNMKERWSLENEKKIIQRHPNGKDPHKLELDVVGACQTDYILISCKSSTYKFHPETKKALTEAEADEFINKASREAKSTASNLGRFAHAILAHRGKPQNIDPELARVVDWRVICEPGKLRAVIEELAASKSQTKS